MEFDNYSDFCLFITENDDDVEYILSYDNWSIVKIGSEYYYYEHIYEGSSDVFYKVEPIADLHYNIINDIKSYEPLDYLFDCDFCGEQITDDEIIYWWFITKGGRQ